MQILLAMFALILPVALVGCGDNTDNAEDTQTYETIEEIEEV